MMAAPPPRSPASPTQVYVPYCSSDLYVGTRDASAIRGYYFHGKYIVKVRDDCALKIDEFPVQKSVTNLRKLRNEYIFANNCDIFS